MPPQHDWQSEHRTKISREQHQAAPRVRGNSEIGVAGPWQPGSLVKKPGFWWLVFLKAWRFRMKVA
jgi:hypothetical protein